MEYYQQTAEQSLKTLASSPEGLSSTHAAKALEQHGTNELQKEQGFTALKILADQIFNLMSVILLVAGIVSIIAGYYEHSQSEIIEGWVILGIVFLNAIMGFYQEYSAEKSLEALQRMISPMVRVKRDGTVKEIEAKNIVPGDILLISEGDKISADCRLIKSERLKINEAALTGESTPVHKSLDALSKKDLPVGDQKNMLFMGTSVMSGTGEALVVATGMDTKFGRIAKLTQQVVDEKTPLQKELDKTGKFIAKVVFGLCIFIFVYMFFVMHGTWLEAFIYAVVFAVAAVPEGLPLTVTMALSIGVKRMVKENALVKRLTSVETLGSCSVVCSDKTGTLTKNEMTVQEIFVNNELITVTGTGYKPEGEFFEDEHRLTGHEFDELRTLMRGAVLCNDSRMNAPDDKKALWTILGDPTEGSLLVAAKKAGVNIDILRKQYPRVKEIPFDSERKRMTTMHKVDGHYIAYSKGAPETILERCTHISNRGTVTKLSAQEKKRILDHNEMMATKALRVLGFAYKEVKKTDQPDDEIESNLVFVGLMGMIDPPREEVKGAVAECKKAGIKVVVITGDHGITARAVAEKIGILDHTGLVVTGPELEKMDDTKLEQVLKEDVIFARVSPEHKLRIVSHLQALGHVVAVTGDGVNDAPALKKGDIGIAMGITGTDVSKEASDMVLMDDNFATIVAAIREGRTIYENIKKFLRYLFTGNIGEIVTIFSGLLLAPLLAPLFGLAPHEVIVISATQILWINLGTDIFPALALGLEPSEKDIMQKRPRGSGSHMITMNRFSHWFVTGLFIGSSTLLAFILYAPNFDKARTVAFTVLVFSQLMNSSNCRSDDKSIFTIGVLQNKFLLGALAISITMHVLVTEVAFLQTFFNTTSLNLVDWGVVLLFSSAILILTELTKYLNRAHERRATT